MSAQTPSNPLSIEQILCCVGEGTFSDDAVEAACRLGEQLGAQVEFLHVLPVPELLGTRFDRRQIEAMNATRAEEAQAVMRAHLAHRHAGLNANGRPLADQLQVVAGNPPRTLLERARERRVDLFVLGDSGKRRQLDFGGTARALLAKAEAAVLLQTRRPTPIRDVLAPTDLSEASLSALAQTIGLAQRLGAKVHVMHCVHVRPLHGIAVAEGFHMPPPDSFEELRPAVEATCRTRLAALDWGAVEHDLEVLEGPPAEVVLACQDRGDLIAMGTHGHTGLAAALLGGVAYHVMRQAHTPVLALRDLRRSYVF